MEQMTGSVIEADWVMSDTDVQHLLMVMLIRSCLPDSC
jgi:hypothetical protein